MPPEQEATPAPPGQTPPAAPPQAAPPAQAAPDIDLFADVHADPAPVSTATPPPPPAPGARPEYVPEQFWDPSTNATRIEAMAKSWTDLRRKVSQGTGAAPENPDLYAMPKIEGLTEELIKPDDPLWKQVRESAHKAGVSQQQLEAIVAPYIADVLERAKQQPAANPEADQAARAEAIAAEKAKLGPNADLVVKDIKSWILGLKSRGSLTDGEAQALLQSGNANGIRALMKLRTLAGEKPIPLDSLAGETMTVPDAHALMVQGITEKTAGNPSGDEKIKRARAALESMEKRGLLKNVG